MFLTELLEGEYASIEKCTYRRLMEHGFVRGTPLMIYKKMHGITCLALRGSVIACRDYDLKDITVKRDEDSIQEQ